LLKDYTLLGKDAFLTLLRNLNLLHHNISDNQYQLKHRFDRNGGKSNEYVYYGLLGYETFRVVHNLRTSLHAVTLQTNEVFTSRNTVIATLTVLPVCGQQNKHRFSGTRG
jgi:hypothetical protein